MGSTYLLSVRFQAAVAAMRFFPGRFMKSECPRKQVAFQLALGLQRVNPSCGEH